MLCSHHVLIPLALLYFIHQGPLQFRLDGTLHKWLLHVIDVL